MTRLRQDFGVASESRKNMFYAPVREASRRSHTQRVAATISAIQLRPIGIVSVPTVTWA